MSIFRSLTEVGAEGLSNQDRKKVARSNTMALTIFLAGIMYAPLYYFLGSLPGAALIVQCCFANLLVLVLNGAGYNLAARYFQSYCFTFCITLISMAFGHQAGNTLMFLPALTVVFLNFDTKELRSATFILISTTLLATYIDIEIENIVPLIQIAPEHFALMRVAARIGTMLLLFSQLFVFVRSLALSKQQLSTTNSNVVAILESLKESFYFVDRNWIILHANAGATTALSRMSVDGTNLAGKHFLDMHPYMRQQHYAAELINAMETNSSFSGEYWVEKTQTWFELNAQPGPLGMSIMYRNINDRKQAENSVRQSERLQSALFAQAATGLVLTSATGRFVRVNAEMCRIVGYTEAELLNMTINQISFEDDFESNLATVQKLFSGELKSYKNQRRYKNKAGEAVIVSAQGNAIRDDLGEVRYFVVAVQDLTEAKQAEHKLLHSSKMSSLGEMAGSIAHEINSPLAIIQLSAEQLEDVEANGLDTPEKIAQVGSQISATVSRVAKIIRGLKTFSRNADDDKLIETSLEVILDDTLALCRERFIQRQIDIKVQSQPGVEIKCRQTEISQVLLNVLGNAYDAVENLPNGKRWVTVSASAADSILRLTITDSGSGIAPGISDRIFDPFFTTKPFGKGTGLGLSISKGIIEAHGGLIYLDKSSLNTAFIIELRAHVMSAIQEAV